MSEREPETLEAITQQERWRQQALARATEAPPAVPPAGETPAEAFVRRQAEQDRAEREQEELAQRVAFEHPTAPTAEAAADPLRALYVQQEAAQRQLRRRGLRR